MPRPLKGIIMKRSWPATLAVVLMFVALAGVACSDDVDSTSTTLALNPADFSIHIDNRFLPQVPGMMLTYEGTTEDGTTSIEAHLRAETKTVMGVECAVVLRTVSADGQVIERVFYWYAEDAEGNVWCFGSDAQQYDGDQVVGTAGSWEAGVNGAVPGIIMEGDPQVGDVYGQESTTGESKTVAEVLAVDTTLDLPYSHFMGVLETRESSPLQPGVAVEKYYAPGVGPVLVQQVEGGTASEKLVSLFSP
jgi:hypothetical protein